jgi:hypothetical protein
MQHLIAEDPMPQVLRDFLASLSLEERLEALSPEERLRGLSPKELLENLAPEQLEGLRQLLQAQGKPDNTSRPE